MDTNIISADISFERGANPASGVQVSDLYARYEGKITAYARRRTCANNVDEVVAETFLTAWRRRDDVPAEPQTLPWLYGVSRKVLANQRRSERRRLRLFERLAREPATPVTPIHLVESADTFSEVASAVEALPDGDAELLRLTAWEGLGPSEIAETLGIEPTAARQRLFRARNRLNTELEKQTAAHNRRNLAQRTAAIVLLVVITIGGVVTSGLLDSPTELETDIVNDIDDMPRQVVELEGDDGANVVDDASPDDVAETDSALPTTSVAPETQVPDLASTTTTVGEQVEPEQASATAPEQIEPVPTSTTVPEQATATSVAESTAQVTQPAPIPAAEGSGTTPIATSEDPESSAAVGAGTGQAAQAQTAATEEIDVLAAPVFDPSGPFVMERDLFVFQLDFADLDDAHAAVATAEAVESFGVSPVVVAGTYALDSPHFAHDHIAVMNAAWGDAWFDAENDRPAAVDEVANRWIETLDGGGHVWVAEGGASDFTAEVLRIVQARRPDLDSKAVVHVVHHVDSNLDRTDSDDRSLVSNATDLIRIDDGNTANGTADLRRPADGFQAATRNSNHRDGWTAAFDVLPAEELDFSDTVTALYLLGVGTDVVADTADFQEVFVR